MGNLVTIPPSIEGVDSAWTSSTLGLPVTVTGIDPVGVGATFTSVLYRVHMRGRGAPSSVIVKLPVPDPKMRAPATALGLYTREVTWYRELAESAPIRSPKLLHADVDEEGAEFVIVMEDLAPLVAVDQIVGLSLYQAEAVADNLARFHAWSWESPRLTNEAAVFPALDSPIGRAVNAQLAHLFSMGWSHYRLVVPRIAPEISDFADRFGEFVPILIDRLATPRTLVHGELRSDNLFFAADGEPIIIDFQMALQEAGIRDLAYVVSQSLPVELRRAHEGALVRRYWEGLVSAGVRDYSFARAQHQYRSAVAFGLVYPMVAFTRYETANERGREVLKTMLGRAIEAIEDNQAVETVVSEGSVKFD